MTPVSPAFGPLEDRYIKEFGGAAADRISVRDYMAEVEIGAFQSERDVTQRLKFSVVVEVRPSSGAQTDDVDDILSYDAVTEAIEGELDAERLNLLETLAERIATRILTEPQPLRVFVRIEKLDRGPGNLGVEIVRERTAQMDEAAQADTLPPRVIYLPEPILLDPALGEMVSRLKASAVPSILCVGSNAATNELTGPARRIALLEIEQVAWQLAQKEPDCVPVGTRTELDWGVKNQQLSVWTPSKMVLDAVDGPDGADGLVLAQWFAKQVEAAELLVLGPCGANIGDMPVRSVALEDLT